MVLDWIKWASGICKRCQSEKKDYCEFGYVECQHLQKKGDNELVKKIKSLRPWWSMEEIEKGLKKLKIFTRDEEEKRKRGREEFLKFLNILKERVEERRKGGVKIKNEIQKHNRWG